MLRRVIPSKATVAAAATTTASCAAGLGQRRCLVEEGPLIQHSARLTISARPTPAVELFRSGLPKVVATVGPASASPHVLEGLVRAGMSVGRFNMSHGTHAEHHRAMAALRQQALHLGAHVGTALDTRGPEVRIGTFNAAAAGIAVPAAAAASTLPPTSDAAASDAVSSVTYNHGETVTVSVNPAVADNGGMARDLLYVDYPELLAGPRRPTHLLVGDGALELTVESVNLKRGELRCFVTRGATVFDRSNVHVVGAEVKLPLVSDKDEADLAFGVANDVDFVFASFVRSARQVHELRGILGTRGRHTAIVAKVETLAALEKLDSIIEAADGIMVARGDLGVALPDERAFFAQKKIIAACNLAGKPVLVSTQMLESMVENRRPTRAEATDIANAVIDGADGLVLSAESARGQHPEAAVRALQRISGEAVRHVRHRKRFSDMIATMNVEEGGELAADPVSGDSFRTAASASSSSDSSSSKDDDDRNLVRATLPRTIGYIAEAAVLTSFECGARCIITATVSGNSVLKLRQCCPKAPIVAVCKTASIARQLSLVRGVTPLHFEDIPYANFDALVDAAVARLVERGAAVAAEASAAESGGVWVRRGDMVVVTCTDSSDPTDFTAFLKIRVVQ
jgi:pyruvate kinase